MAHSTYEARLREVRENYTTNNTTVSISVPKFLLAEWRRRKAEGEKIPLSRVVSSALHFALYGPHPFANGVDGLNAALDQYSEHDREKDDRLTVEALNQFLEFRGIPARVTPIDPNS